MELLLRDFFISVSRRWFTHLCHITTMPSYKIDIARHIREMWYVIYYRSPAGYARRRFSIGANAPI